MRSTAVRTASSSAMSTRDTSARPPSFPIISAVTAAVAASTSVAVAVVIR
ncbi:hypothetical protein [Embleya hyalina]|nr:hypothetical protein [Embleya hyalina]